MVNLCTPSFGHDFVLSGTDYISGAKIAQSIQRLATGSTVRGSNPGGDEILRNRPYRPWGPPSLLYNGSGFLSGVKRPERGVDHPPHLAPRLKEEHSYTSAPPSRSSWSLLRRILPLPLQITFQYTSRTPSAAGVHLLHANTMYQPFYCLGKSKVKAVPMHTDGLLEVHLHSCLTSVLEEGDCSASSPVRFTSGERTPGRQ